MTEPAVRPDWPLGNFYSHEVADWFAQRGITMTADNIRMWQTHGRSIPHRHRLLVCAFLYHHNMPLPDDHLPYGFTRQQIETALGAIDL